MRWTIRNPFSKVETKASGDAQSFQLGVGESLSALLGFGMNDAATPTGALNLYDESSAVSIPVNLVAEQWAMLEPVLIIDKKLVDDHPVLDLLKNPSPLFTGQQFREATAKNYLITGEAATVALGNVNRPPLQINAISPQFLSPVAMGASDAPESWMISGRTLTGDYTAKSLTAKEVKYIHTSNLRELRVTRNFSTKNNSLLRGQSPLVSVSSEVRSQILGSNHNLSLLEDGGKVSLVFNFEQKMSPTDFEETKARVIEQYGGPGGAKIGVTAGPKMTIQQTSASMVDMDFVDLQKMATKTVALAYHIPLPLFSDERQTLNNFSIAKEALYDDAVIPLDARIWADLGRFLLPRYGLDPNRARITFNPDQVSALVSRRNDELSARVTMGLETKNELRALLGREAAEGGDVLYQAANLVPLGFDLFTDDNATDHMEQTARLRGARSGVVSPEPDEPASPARSSVPPAAPPTDDEPRDD